MKNAGINPCNASEIQKQLLFAETISKEIQGPVNEKKNKKESIRKEYLEGLLRYAANKTNRWKKTLESKWKSYEFYQT